MTTRDLKSRGLEHRGLCVIEPYLAKAAVFTRQVDKSAYLQAERIFTIGLELDDWLQAETSRHGLSASGLKLVGWRSTSNSVPNTPKALIQFGPLPAQTVIMIRTAFSFLFAVLLSLVALGAQTAEQDMKDAGQDMKKSAKATGDAAKKTGRAAKKSSKKVVHKSAKKVKQDAAKVEDKTK